MVLTQRGAQLAHLRAAFDDCAGQQEGKVIVVSGAVGSGKTALLETFASQVAAHPVHVLSATGSQAERTLPFGVMDQLIDSSGLTRIAIQEIATAVRHLPLTPHDESASTPPPRDAPSRRTPTTVQELLGSLARLAGPAPLVLMVDDVQHADSESLRCLLYLIRRTRHKQVLTVLTESPMLRCSYPHFQAELLSQPHVSRLRLGPLSDEALTELAHTHPSPLSRLRIAREALTLTGGSPLLMRSLLDDDAPEPPTGPGEAPSRSGWEVGVPADATGVHSTFDQAVLRCLYRHEPEVRDTAQALAVFGRPVTHEVLVRFLRVAPEYVVQSMQLLRRSGLVKGTELRHPRVARAILADLSSEVRCQLHRRAAELLHDHGAEPGVTAQHLVAADWAEPAWAQVALRDAAAQALAAGRPDVAGTCLRLIHRPEANRGRWSATDSMLVRARWQINPLSLAADLEALTTPGADAATYDPAALNAVPALLWHGRTDTACAIERSVAGREERDPEVRAQLAAARLRISLAFPDRYPRERAAAGKVADGDVATSETGRQLDTMTLLADALIPERARPDTAPNAELMIRRYMADDGALGLMAAPLLALLYSGRPDLAADWTRALLKRPALGHAPTWKAIVHAIRGEAALRLGLLGEADEQARAALSVITPQAWGIAVAAPLSTLVGTATETNRFEDAVRWLAKPVPAEAFRTPVGLHYLSARARFHLAAGRRRAALDDLHWCGQEATTWRMDTAALVPWRLDLARVRLTYGEHGEATRLLEEQLSEERVVDDRTRGTALRLLAGLRPPEHGAPLLRQAIELLEGCGDRVELARALAGGGTSSARAATSAESRPLPPREERLAQVTGAPQTAQRTGRTTAEVSLRAAATPSAQRQHPGGLSQAERRVATLAAQGHTNRQISGKLFITVSTVEQHLTRVYRKLDVKHRTELAKRLAAVRAGVPHADG
ncbi:LuxR family transcriptional regulator [Streptomyces sp. AJS327]|uniref:helix-turn-helix transcriptional regulator n=1 Tax=Streptomyces sp. AJS327 TaxID=2545265 RepID=UPI0015DE2042|nr:LuxR family transcriptional regulator [Streptomyces sp. AJS327]QNN81293.1 IonRI [Streptomyces sp.]